MFPHLCRLPINNLHKTIFKLYKKNLKETFPNREGCNIAIAAPRGYAKSTLISLILPLHSIIYKKERYIIIISATLKQARQRLKNIKTELLTNNLLRQIYGDLTKNKNVWNASSVDVCGVLVEVFSAGTEIRGISIGDYRPTKIILDDAELSEGAESSERREKLLEWFKEVVENLGDRYTHIEVIGTLLHRDSLLSTLLERPDFKTFKFRSIEKFSEATEMWNSWAKKFTDLTDEKRLENASKFFEENKISMLSGTRVLWHAKEDYYSLMTQLTVRGKRAFFKEKQNEPLLSDSRILNPELFRYFRIDSEERILIEPENSKDNTALSPENSMEIADKRIVMMDDLKIFGFLDSAMGKEGGGRRRGGDYAAIVTIGVDSHKYIYVLDVWIKRLAPTIQIGKIFELHKKFNFICFGIETNCFQELLLIPLEEEKKKMKEAGDNPELKIQEISQRKKKNIRIASLEPLIANGWILFNRDLPEKFFEQCEEFPSGLYDDGPDALEGAIAVASMWGNTISNSVLPSPPRKAKPTLTLF